MNMEGGERRYFTKETILKPKLKRKMKIKKIYEFKKKIAMGIYLECVVYRTLDIMNMIKPIFIKTFSPVPSKANK